MATEMPATAGVFTRASSGLVRQVKTQDVMYYGVQQIALSYIVFIVLAWGFYPGASMPLAALIATLAGLAMGICYAMFATLYPRSGGEYVYLSRTLTPVIGFAVSFSFAFWETFYTGINGAFFSLYSVSPMLAGLGVQTKSQGLLDAADWFSHGWGIFIAGSVMIIGLTYIQYRGAAVYFRWQRWATYLAFGSLAVTILVLVLAATGVLDFKANFNDLAGAGAYGKVVADGVASGVAPPAAFDFGETMKFMIWPAFSIWFAVASTSFSGEIKNVQRSQLIGITGAMVVMGIAFVALLSLYEKAFGGSFLLSASANGLPLDAPPFVPFFTAVAGGNVVLTIITSVWVLAIAVFVTGTTLVYSSRAALAWAIDGVAPERLGDVNEKYHSPHWALLLWAIIGEIFLGLFAFTSLLGPISGFLGLAISFLVVSVWAVFFPFVKKEQFENSPIAWRVGGFPLMSLLGIFASVIVGYAFYRLMVDSSFSLNLKFANIGALLGVVFAVIWFYAWKAYRKRQGVDLDRRYGEIPIE
jgi:amino acid transporter